jgi:benzylsuccinate CoA-transferase BbsE subunit
MVGSQQRMNVFSSLRVIDFTGELGPYAGRLFAGLGADVVHLEPLRGDPLRERGPFYRNLPGRERSLPFLYYNAGKRSLALDLEKERGAEIFLRLCRGADLLIESAAPAYLDGLAIGYDALHRLNPRLVHTSITPFGHSGPYRNYKGTDLTCSALGGFLFLAGVEEDKPVRACDNQAYRMAEAYAAVGSAVALLHARQTGIGQFVDVSCIEAVATALENAPQYFDLEGKIRRGRGREAGTGTIHPCRDGFVVLVAIMGRNRAMWEAFVQWMKATGVEEWEVFRDERWIEPAYRSSGEGYDTFCRIFERYTSQHGKLHLYETGQSFRVAVTPVSNGKDLLENPQLNYRGFWQTLRHENLDVRHESSGGEVTCPGAPVRFGRLSWKIDRPAPTFGQHTAGILQEIGYRDREVAALAREGVVCPGEG